jgi:hypothetical protein
MELKKKSDALSPVLKTLDIELEDHFQLVNVLLAGEICNMTSDLKRKLDEC